MISGYYVHDLLVQKLDADDAPVWSVLSAEADATIPIAMISTNADKPELERLRQNLHAKNILPQDAAIFLLRDYGW